MRVLRALFNFVSGQYEDAKGKSLIIENETLRDYLLLVLLTGLRREEAATLKWENVDLAAKTFFGSQ